MESRPELEREAKLLQGRFYIRGGDSVEFKVALGKFCCDESQILKVELIISRIRTPLGEPPYVSGNYYHNNAAEQTPPQKIFQWLTKISIYFHVHGSSDWVWFG